MNVVPSESRAKIGEATAIPIADEPSENLTLIGSATDSVTLTFNPSASAGTRVAVPLAA